MTWIPVTERLPDDDLAVLVYTRDGEVWMGWHQADAWYLIDGSDAVGVTHWADLPEPPQ